MDSAVATGGERGGGQKGAMTPGPWTKGVTNKT